MTIVPVAATAKTEGSGNGPRNEDSVGKSATGSGRPSIAFPALIERTAKIASAAANNAAATNIDRC